MPAIFLVRQYVIPGFDAWHRAGTTITLIFLQRTPSMFNFTAVVTLLAILFYVFTTIQVSKARTASGIKAPAISGNPDFERVFRVQMNTLEWMPIFLPALWLFAIYISDGIAALLGLVWIAGRILYLTGYSQAANKRGTGFGIQAAAAALLWLGALGAIIWRLIHA
jgi:glutathione S-transferase